MTALYLVFPTNDVVSIYVGRLSPEKNLSLLIRAFYGVAMTYDHVRLLVVGDGPERENLEAQVKHMNIGNKVFFTGMVEYKDIPAYLATTDIFVTPSSAETFGLSTVEAMAAGLPTLGIDAPGTGDIIEDGITGLIVADDLAVFTAKLVMLSTNHELRRFMGKQGYPRIRRNMISKPLQAFLFSITNNLLNKLNDAVKVLITNSLGF